jgi:pyruvate kinase
MVVTSEPLWRKLAMVRGVAPLLAPEAGGPEAWLRRARDWLYARGLAQRGDPAVLLHAADPSQSIADSLRTVRLD